VQKFENRLSFDKVIEFKGGPFLRHSVVEVYCVRCVLETEQTQQRDDVTRNHCNVQRDKHANTIILYCIESFCFLQLYC